MGNACGGSKSALNSVSVSSLIERSRKTGFLSIESVKLATFPNDILTLDKIHSLAITGCNLRTVPLDIFMLPKLRNLSLSGNALSELPALEDKNPNDLSSCILKSLDVSYNKLQHLPHYIMFLLPLVKLIATNNELVRILTQDDSVERKTSSRLEQLDLSNNYLSVVPLLLRACSRLKELNLSNNRFTKLAGNDVWKELPKLRILNLEDNNLSALPLTLLRDSHVDTLCLKGNPFCEGHAYYQFEGFSEYEARAKKKKDKAIHGNLHVDST